MTSDNMNLDRNPGHRHDDPFDGGYLPVSDIHKLYYEQYGNKSGKPVIFLHGGPGGSTSKANTQYFDPAVYRVVLLDQRGAGRSKPLAELRENTSELLVNDIETLRRHLNIQRWYLIFGGSWGSTLALLYAQTYPEVVGNLVLRGIFTARCSETNWSRGGIGAAYLYPDAYDEFLSHLPTSQRNDPMRSYYHLLTSDNYLVRKNAARSWNKWDLTIGALTPDVSAYDKINNDDWSLSHARLEAHYFVHGAWLEPDQLLNSQNLRKITHIPTPAYKNKVTIVQGRYDIICPPRTAWELYKSWPGSEIFIISGAGHSASELGIHNKLIEVCARHACS